MTRDEDALRSVAEQLAAVMTSAGLPKMPARVMMALMVSEEGALTAHELAEWLGASAAAISGAVRYLQTTGITRRVSRPGSRRDLYELPDDTWYSIVQRALPVYDILARLGDSAAQATGNQESDAKARLVEMSRFYRFVGSRLPILMAEWEEERIGRLEE